MEEKICIKKKTNRGVTHVFLFLLLKAYFPPHDSSSNYEHENKIGEKKLRKLLLYYIRTLFYEIPLVRTMS